MSGAVLSIIGSGGAPFSVSVSPLSVFGTSPTSTVVTGSFSVSVSGGSGSFTYAMEIVSADFGVSLTSTTNPSSSFIATGVVLGEAKLGTARCLVTDSVSGASVYSDVVSGTMERI